MGFKDLSKMGSTSRCSDLKRPRDETTTDWESWDRINQGS